MGVIDDQLAGKNVASGGGGGGVIDQQMQQGSVINDSSTGPTDNVDRVLGAVAYNPVSNAVRRGVGGVLDILGRPGEAVLSAGRAGAETKDQGAVKNAAAIAGGLWKGLSGQEHLTPTEAVLGRGTTAQQAYGSAGTAKGLGGRILDFTAGVATDPTTILTGGTKEAGEAGLKAIGDTAYKQALDLTEHEGLASAARQTAINAAKQKGVKAAYDMVGGKDAVRKTLMDTATEAGVKPERFANKALKGLDRTAPDKLELALRDTGLTKPEEAIKTGLSSAKDAAAGTKLGDAGRFAERLVKYGAAEKQAFGKDTGEAVLGARREASAEKTMLTKQAQSQVNAALKETKVKAGSAEDTLVRNSLENVNGRQALEQSNPELLPLHDALDNLRKSQTADQISAGVLKPDEIHNLNTYVHRETTPEFRAAQAKPEFSAWLKKQSGGVKKALSSGGAANARTILPELSVAEANKQLEPALREAGVLKDGEHVFELGALGPMMKRAEAANEAVTQAHYMKNLEGLKAADGNPILKRVENASASEVPSNYKVIDAGPLGQFYAHPALEKDLLKVRDVVTNNEDIKQLQHLYQNWMKFYKTSATTLPVGTSFPLKKLRGDLFNNYLAGVTNPADYAHSFKIKSAVAKALKDPANRDALIAGKYEDVIKGALSEPDYKLFTGARKTGAISSGFGAEDLGATKHLEQQSTGHQVLKQFGTEGKVLQTSRGAFQGIDEEARLTHFIAKMHETGDADKAAASVRKYLFDYSELTPAERKVRATVIPFYTFMRKNVPLQVENMLTKPSKYTLRLHAAQALGENGAPDGVPNYQKGEMNAPTAVSKALGLDPASAVVSPSTPFSEAEQTIAKAGSPLSLIPGVRSLVPASDRAQSAGDAARQELSLAGGPVAELGKYAAGEATGKNLFSGASNKPGNNQHILRLLEALTPATGRVESVGKLKTRAAILKALTGIKVSEAKTQ